MLLKIFRGTGPGVILLIVLTLVVLWGGTFVKPQPEVNSLYEIKPMPLYSLITDLFTNHRTAGTILTMILLTVMLFLLVNFNTTVFFINERTFLPAVFYLLLTAIFPELQVLNPVLPASICLMLALFRIMDSYRKAGNISNFFDAGILIGIGSMFYANILWFGILPIIGIFMLRAVNFKEIIITLLGLATPFILLFGIYYALDRDLAILMSDITENLTAAAPDYKYPNLTIIVCIWAGLILVVSTGYLISLISSKKIKSRKAFNLLLTLLFFSLGLFFILRSVSTEMIWVSGIPASYVLTHYFVFAKKKLISEIAFSFFFLLIVLLQILHFI